MIQFLGRLQTGKVVMVYQGTADTQNKAIVKRNLLLRSATTLVSTSGFEGAKIAAIAQLAGTSVGSVYSYFGSREELLVEVFRTSAEHELTVTRHQVFSQTDPYSQLDSVIRSFASRALKDRKMAWSLLFEPVSKEVDLERLKYRHNYVELVSTILQTGIGKGVFVPQNIVLSASALIGAISESLIGRISPVSSSELSLLSDYVIVEEIRKLCFRAIGIKDDK
ncbi:MAG: TetR/AcrR family transcriptional regulator [Mycobacteriaceae bacterium]